ncbi:glutaredoxin family protein [Massilia sp. SM-13]|uniref:glutaredoxin family protein n=1 Tax=Pseudoduganella rhizocola TaxID=3382643 RepID=UPI0038B5A481
MIASKLKTVVLYALILAAGLLVGLGAAKLPKLLERPYQTGNYSSHFASLNSKVVVYGTTTCPFCAKAREYLAEKKVVYSDFNVDNSEEARKKYKTLNVKAVPAILIGDRLITGFRPDAIDDALKAVAQ